MVEEVDQLPPADASSITLVAPTPGERDRIWRSNGEFWRGRLSMKDYLGREQHLSEQTLTKDGGINFWLLTDASLQPDARPILSSCETLQKRAYIKQPDGPVREHIVHGIASVFANPKYRGRGYGRRMMQLLGPKLDDFGSKEGSGAPFSILYSDIGKEFYDKTGWKPFASDHISMQPQSGLADQVAQPIHAQDLPRFCEQDSAIMKDTLEQSRSDQVLVALVPDVATMTWHHAREEYVAQKLLGRVPTIKGAFRQCGDGKMAWCIWSRFFSNESTNGNVLHILRMVIPGEVFETPSSSIHTGSGSPDGVHEETLLRDITYLLRMAQHEASEWEMNEIQIWNPSALVIKAARSIDPSINVIHREEESIASLRWNPAIGSRLSTQWAANEKFGWC